MARTETDETFLTVAEVAEMLKLNQQTVRNWIDQGSLPALRVGRRVRIKRSDFERILEESYSGRNAASTDSTSRGTAGVAAASGVAPTGGVTPGGDQPAPSAQDFWDGESVGIPEPAPAPSSASEGNGRS